MLSKVFHNLIGLLVNLEQCDTRKCPLCRHCLAPPEGPGTQGTPGVNLGTQTRGSGGDSKAI